MRVESVRQWKGLVYVKREDGSERYIDPGIANAIVSGYWRFKADGTGVTISSKHHTLSMSDATWHELRVLLSAIAEANALNVMEDSLGRDKGSFL